MPTAGRTSISATIYMKLRPFRRMIASATRLAQTHEGKFSVGFWR